MRSLVGANDENPPRTDGVGAFWIIMRGAFVIIVRIITEKVLPVGATDDDWVKATQSWLNPPPCFKIFLTANTVFRMAQNFNGITAHWYVSYCTAHFASQLVVDYEIELSKHLNSSQCTSIFLVQLRHHIFMQNLSSKSPKNGTNFTKQA